jgi:DNA-binding NarL/FixJ family response regulator
LADRYPVETPGQNRPNRQGHANRFAMTVLVCDDHPLVRTALCATAGSMIPEHRPVPARDFTEAWRLAEEEDEIVLCLVDLHMPGATPTDGLAGIKSRAPEAKLVVITGSESDEDLLAALRIGVDGFVPKTAEPGVVEAAIRLVMAGGRYLPPRVAELASVIPASGDVRETNSARPNFQAAYGRISERQRDVVKLMAQGRSNKEIAKALDLSPATVKTHIANIIAAFGAANRTEAALHARESGLLDT